MSKPTSLSKRATLVRAIMETMELRMLMSAGALDPTFGTGGLVSNLPTGGFDAGQRTVLAEDAEGRVIVADSWEGGRAVQTSVTRLNADGSVDISFGTNGVFAYGDVAVGGAPFPPLQYVNQILPEPDGNILLLGFQIQELSSTGMLNASFGGGTYYSGPSVPGGAAAGVLLPNGKLMVVDGTTANIYQFNADGTPDNSFGTNGVATLSSPYSSLSIQDIALNKSGQPVLSVAVQLDSTTAAFGTARITAAGKIDTTYGNGGYSLSPWENLTPTSSEIAIAPDGSVDQLVTFAITTSANIFLQAYSSDGKDVGGGRFNPPAAANGDTDFDELNDLAVQSDGKVVAVGLVTQSDSQTGDTGVAVVDRFDAISPALDQTITLDPAFNGSGSLEFPSTGGRGFPVASSVTIDSAGRIVLTTDGSTNSATVARVLTAAPTANPPVALTGTVIGTSGSYHNQGNVAAKAFDGNLTTFFDAPQANGNWAGLNLGTPQSLAQVSFAPRAGWAQRMIGGEFQGSSTPDFSSDVQTLYTINTTPPVGQLTTVGLGIAGPFQYVRYLSPAGSFGNIAEAQFFRAPQALAGSAIGTTGSYQNQGNTIAKVFDDNLSTFFDAPSGSGAWVGLDLGSAKVVNQVEYAPRAGWQNRMVGGEIQASNSANFSSGVVTLYTIASTPQAGVMTPQVLNNTTAYRYYRYIGPANSFCNIAELEFDG